MRKLFICFCCDWCQQCCPFMLLLLLLDKLIRETGWLAAQRSKCRESSSSSGSSTITTRPATRVGCFAWSAYPATAIPVIYQTRDRDSVVHYHLEMQKRRAVHIPSSKTPFDCIYFSNLSWHIVYVLFRIYARTIIYCQKDYTHRVERDIGAIEETTIQWWSRRSGRNSSPVKSNSCSFISPALTLWLVVS